MPTLLKDYRICYTELEEYLRFINHENDWRLDSLQAIVNKQESEYEAGAKGLVVALYEIAKRLRIEVDDLEY